MEPLVSVIIPVYNVLPYLREALDSVINQTYKNLEILVVDDGSTDGSGDVCDEYLSDHRVIVIHQENRGLSGARNTALDRMTGEYVAFLDSDDTFMPEMIEKMLEAMIRNRTDISICEYITCYARKSIYSNMSRRARRGSFYKENVLTNKEALNLLIVDKISWTVWNKIYKRHIWENTRFPEGENYEDMQVMCQIFGCCQKVLIIPESLVLYRKRPASITATFSDKNVLDHLHATQIVEKYIIEHSPAVFSEESKLLFQERNARFLSVLYAQLLFYSNSCGIKEQIQKEALLKWNLLGKKIKLFHSKITCFLFINIPGLILPTQACWQFGKRLLRKARV